MQVNNILCFINVWIDGSLNDVCKYVTAVIIVNYINDDIQKLCTVNEINLIYKQKVIIIIDFNFHKMTAHILYGELNVFFVNV